MLSGSKWSGYGGSGNAGCSSSLVLLDEIMVLVHDADHPSPDPTVPVYIRLVTVGGLGERHVVKPASQTVREE
jgi:hypothetical protein